MATSTSSSTLTQKWLIAAWCVIAIGAVQFARLWNSRSVQSLSPRALSSITLALLVWIGLLVSAVVILKLVRRQDSLLVIAARVFVFALPMQFMGFGGRLGIQFGLVDVGDIFLKGWFTVWLTAGTLSVAILSYRALRKRNNNNQMSADGLSAN